MDRGARVDKPIPHPGDAHAPTELLVFFSVQSWQVILHVCILQ